jgi:hypothetical protein
MREPLLILHFLGLSISAGTGVYLAAMSHFAAKNLDRSQIKPLMLGPGSAISNVGTTGLVVLVISGLGLLTAIGDLARLDFYFWVKMGLVALLIAYLSIVRSLAGKAKQEPGVESMLKIKKLSPIGLLLSVFTVGAAVLAFH